MLYLNSLKNKKGQATVEYFLLLVVVISLALSIGGPLGKRLKKFSGALVGPQGYYACLTKEGLLPVSSSGNSCRKAEAAFNIATNPGGLGPGGGSGGEDQAA